MIIIPKLNIFSKRLSMFQERLWNTLMRKPYDGYFDNIAGVRFHKLAYGTIGAKQHLFGVQSPKVQPYDMAVSSFPYGNFSAAGAGAGGGSGLTTQIDRGRDEFDQTPGTGAHPCYAYGYNIINEGYLALATFGAIDDDTYDDGGSTSRTIKSLMATDPCGGADDDVFYFSLDGTSISNSDTTWLDITWDDAGGTPRTVDRSADATAYTASLNGSTHWRDTNADWDWTDLDANTDLVLTTS